MVEVVVALVVVEVRVSGGVAGCISDPFSKA